VVDLTEVYILMIQLKYREVCLVVGEGPEDAISGRPRRRFEDNIKTTD
jgi:hypothetical protein